MLSLVGVVPPTTAAAQPTPEPTMSESKPSHNGGGWLSGVLHGEGLVQTKNGPVRVVLQNGEATKVTGTTMTVRSSDGFTRNWQYAPDLKVYNQQQHTQVQPGSLQAGTTLSIVGTAASANAATWTAKWAVVRPAQPQGQSPMETGSP
jgi:hypothetical protein